MKKITATLRVTYLCVFIFFSIFVKGQILPPRQIYCDAEHWHHPAFVSYYFHEPGFMAWKNGTWRYASIIVGDSIHQMFYAFSRFGETIDSVHTDRSFFTKVQQLVYPPCEPFNRKNEMQADYSYAALEWLRTNGLKPPRERYLDARKEVLTREGMAYVALNSHDISNGKSTLEKMLLIEDHIRSNLYRTVIMNSELTNGAVPRVTTLHIREVSWSVKENDTTLEYFNPDDLSRVTSILAESRNSSLFVKNKWGDTIDIVRLNPGSFTRLAALKTNAFVVYRGYLEYQRQIQAEWEVKAMSRIESLKSGNAHTAVYGVNSIKYWQDVLEHSQQQLQLIDQKIDYYLQPYQGFVEDALNQDNCTTYDLENDMFNTRHVEIRGNERYELTDNRGNVLAVVSDRKNGIDSNGDGKIDYYEPEVIAAADYYAFGEPKPGRSFNKDSYPYGFNGKEDDLETGYQDYGMRIYDPRLGRFLSVDPLARKYPWYSPYMFAGNKPIRYKDIDGAEEESEENAETDREEFEKSFRKMGEMEREEETRFHEEALKDPTTRFLHDLNMKVQMSNYWTNALNAASFVLTDGNVRDNNKLGNVWDDLIYEVKLKNPDYVGVARQVSLKITGMVNGQQMVARVRIDNVGIRKNNATGEPIFDLTEAKYSFEELTENNIKQALTPQQKNAYTILISGKNVQFYIRGTGSAEKLSRALKKQGEFENGQNITGQISEIKIVVPGRAQNETPVNEPKQQPNQPKRKD